MNASDQVLRDGACCAMELAARRGSVALEKAWSRFSPRQRALVPLEFISALRLEAAQRAEVSR